MRDEHRLAMNEALNGLGFFPSQGLYLPLQRVIGVGFDLIEVSRIQRDIEEYPDFTTDNFTPAEIAYSTQPRSVSIRAQRFAARFAAKEAVYKALGGVFDRDRSLRDISVLREESGQPIILLQGAAQRRAQAVGASDVFVSFAHLRTMVGAVCVAGVKAEW